MREPTQRFKDVVRLHDTTSLCARVKHGGRRREESRPHATMRPQFPEAGRKGTCSKREGQVKASAKHMSPPDLICGTTDRAAVHGTLAVLFRPRLGDSLATFRFILKVFSLEGTQIQFQPLGTRLTRRHVETFTDQAWRLTSVMRCANTLI